MHRRVGNAARQNLSQEQVFHGNYESAGEIVNPAERASSCTLHVLRCTDVSQPTDGIGHSATWRHVRVTSAVTPTPDIRLRTGGAKVKRWKPVLRSARAAHGHQG
jgi:hypothetical protein